MDKFNSNNFNVNKFNPQFHNAHLNRGIHNNATNNSFIQHLTPKFSLQRSFNYPGLTNLNMNNLFGNEKSIYMKELMNLPRDMKEILVLLQNTTQNVSAGKNMSSLMSANLNLSALAEMMQNNGKNAIAKLISALPEMSKQGVDTSQMKDMMKLINASVSVAGQESQTQAVKTLMLLYLPWLPLQEGKDFELEVEASSANAAKDETVLSIFISTVNYGNIKILIMSKTENSFDIIVKCINKFPQKKLLSRINTENKKHSIQTDIIFDEKDVEKSEEKKNHQAKVTISNLYGVTPYLLVLSNILIKNIIELDNAV